MTVRTALSIAALAVAMVFAAPRTAHVAPRTPSGLILGRVIDAATGQPISSAVVHASTGGKASGAGVLTGADGRFVFSAVPAGDFTLTAERPGYFEAAYGRRRPLGDGVPFRLKDGERRGDAVIHMWPWASIAGTVVDELGRRVPGVPVDAIRKLGDGTLAPNGDGGSAVTDVHGEYRIQHLVPGTYVVLAGCRSTSVVLPPDMALPASMTGAPLPGSAPGDPIVMLDAAHRNLLAVSGPVRQARDPREKAHPLLYVTSYYGGATNLWQATGIDVALGQQVPSIDFAMVLKPGVRIAGAVVGPKGPVADAVVRLLPTDFDPSEIDMATPDVASAVSGADGSFSLPAVPVGNYLLDAYRLHEPTTMSRQSASVPQLSDLIAAIGMGRLDGAGGSARDTEGYWSRMSLIINGRDIPDLLVTMRTGVKVSGDATFQRPVSTADGGAPPQFRLALEHGDDPPVVSAAIRMDRPGPIEIKGARPGWYVLRATDLPAGWEISSAMIGGRDITGLPFEIGSSDLAGLLLTVGDRATELRGDVLDPQGRAAAEATVVIFPSDMATWKSVARSATHLQALHTIDGGYAFRGLAAGEYCLAAVDDAMLADWPGPELLRKLMATATRVRVASGERRVVNLTARPPR